MKRKFTLLLMALLALTGFKSWGQTTEVQIGNGTEQSNIYPFTSLYNYSYSEILYTATEILNAGGGAGSINSISFYALPESKSNTYSFNIYMRSVTRNSYTGAESDWETVSAEDVVGSGSVTSGESGWLTFNLTTPFQWDGTSNLLIALDNNSGVWGGKFFYRFGDDGNPYYAHVVYTDNFDIDPYDVPTSNLGWSCYHSTDKFRPNIKLTIEPSASCPAPTGLAASNVTATGATISWTGNGAENYDLAYGVASTFDLENPSTYAVQNTTATSVQLSGLTAETEYKCAVKAHCSDEDESAWSSAISFTPSAKLTICDASNFDNRFPLYGLYADAAGTQSQFIIPSEMISVMKDCNITSMKFYIRSNANPTNFALPTWRGYIKEVNYTEMSGLDNEEGAVTFFQGTLTTCDNGLGLQFDFSEPFTYNGGNLLIGFDIYTNTPNKWSDCYFWGQTQTYHSAFYKANNSQAVSFIPKTTFTYEQSGPRYTVTVNQPEEGGTISADPMANVAPETAVTLSATPSFGYEFGQWTVVDEGGNPVTLNGEATAATNGFSMPESNVTVSATFNTLEMYAITFDESITWTEMSANHESAPEGTEIVLSYTENEAYIFNFWTVNGVQIEGNTFEMPGNDVEVSMNYTERSRYSVNIGSLENGTITADPSEDILGGTEVTLTIEPATGYALTNLTVTEATSGNEVEVTDNTFEMPEDDVNVTATFSAVYYVQIDPQLVGGTITYTDLTSATAFAAGTTVYLTPEAYTDYVFVDNSIVVTRTDNSETVAVNYNPNMGAYYIEMPESNVTVTATFNAIPYYEVTKVVNPMYSGYFDVNKTSHIEAGEQIVIYGIYPAEGYEFASVVVTRDDTGADVTTTLYYGSYYFNMPDSDVTVTVSFNALPRYSVSVGEVVNGTITVDEPYENILAGTTVYLEANPETDYVLESITVTPEEGNPFEPTQQSWYYYFTMPSSNVTISATFRQLQSYTINYYVNGELDRTMQCREDGLVNNDGPQNVAVPAGMAFEGWGVAEIGTYVTEKPTVLGNAESPTQNCDLYAVLRYTESVPAGSKDGETWVEVTSPTDLSNGDHVIFVEKNNLKILAKRTDLYDGNFRSADVTISSNEINSIPSNAIVFEADNTSGSWKFKFEDAFNTGLTTLADYYGGNLVPLNMGWGGSDSWTIISNGTSVNIQGGSGNYIVYKSGDFTVDGSSVYKKSVLFKKYNPFITTNYYMTSVLANGEVAANTTAKNIIITTGTVTVGEGVVLTMNESGLFRNEDAANFVFEDGAQFYYTGTETVNATFQKNITGYTGDNDNYYLIANPTDNTTVADLTSNEFDLYTFNPAQALEWNNEHENTALTSGIGYLYANSNYVTLEFAGNLRSAADDMTIDLAYYDGGEDGHEFPGFNLVGNPFACNAYVYNNAGEDFTYYTIVGSEITATTGATIPCTGIFVEASGANQQVTFSTEAPAAPASLLSLTVSQNRGNVIDRAIVRFDGSSNLHKFMLNPDHTNLSIAKDGETFAAVSSETKGELPVSFKAETTGTYTISVNTENVTAGYIHLIDNMTGTDVDLLATPSYTFIGSPRDNENRFTVKFEVSYGQDGDGDGHFAYQNGSELVINGEGTLQIFDVFGRVVISEEVHGQTVNVGGLNTGAYIVRLTGESVKTQKIVVR